MTRGIGHVLYHLKIHAASARARFVLHHEVALRIVANPILNFQSIGSHLWLVLPVGSFDRDESVDVIHPRTSYAVPRATKSNDRDAALRARSGPTTSEETPGWIWHKSNFCSTKHHIVQRNCGDILALPAVNDDCWNIKLATFRQSMYDTKNEEHTSGAG